MCLLATAAASGLGVEELGYVLLNELDVVGGLVACNYFAFLVDEELGEVPLDVGLLVEVRIHLAHHLVEFATDGMVEVEAFKAFLLLEEGEQWVLAWAVHLLS